MAHTPDPKNTPPEDVDYAKLDDQGDTDLAKQAADVDVVVPTTPAVRRTPTSSLASSVEPTPAPSASSAPVAAETGDLAALTAQLREAAAEIAEIAAQAGRLGIAIDAAKALRDGTAPEALRVQVLQRAATAADARDIVAAPPSPILPKSAESPIVAAAKKAASAGISRH